MDVIEFDMKKKLIELEKRAKLICEKGRHKNQMKEIKEKDVTKTRLENIHHEHELERGRIKTAEIRKNIERKRFC